MRLSTRRPRCAAPVVAGALVLATAACGTSTSPAPDADGTSGETRRAGATGDASGPAIQRSTIASVRDLSTRLEAAGITCALEYEGLRDAGRELSLCVIDGDRATLTIWDDPSVLDEFLASDVGRQGVTAVGRNWTVDLQQPAVARKVADALGGMVKQPG